MINTFRFYRNEETKMKLKIFALMGAALMLVGCASTSVEYYEAVKHANEQRARVELAKAQADAERMKSLQAFAYSEDETARTAAVMALSFAGMTGGGDDRAADGMVSPEEPLNRGEVALRWASVLVPSLTNVYAINQNTSVQKRQISANRDVSINTNETMLGFGRLAAGQEAPIVGGQDDVLLFPREPIVGDQDDVLLFPTD